VILWRIATETHSFSADDLSGAGAARHPGRWNDQNEPVVYASTTLALAALETVAHLDTSGLPLNRFVVRIDVPENVWAAKESPPANELPAGWDAVPSGTASARYGSRWLPAGRSPIMLLPSVIVPEERIALINPRHPLAGKLSAAVLRRFEYDLLFRT